MDTLIDKYRQVYQMLEDKESRDIYLNRLNWLISGDDQYIANIVNNYLPTMVPRCGRTIDDLRKLIPSDRKIILYGAGQEAAYTVHFWKNDERFIGFCAKNKYKQEKGYLGYPVISPEELLCQKDIAVVISTYVFRNEIKQILRDGGYPENLIFDEAGYFTQIDFAGQYFGPKFMKYEDEEVFIDAGCLDLQSSLELKKHCKRVRKVYAFEPDLVNYKVCLERKEETAYVEAVILPYGTWSERTELRFRATGSGSAGITTVGDTIISAVPIDEVVTEERVTFIKMDVEGAELESLHGAEKTILRDRPKLAICIYHKPEDMITIPLYIKELVPEYKLYVRHHTNVDLETVLYAVLP